MLVTKPKQTGQMPTYNRVTILEDLSAELFFEIFDYFHFTELYNTFSNLNRRIDGYLDDLSSIYLYFSKRGDLTTTKLNKKQLLCVRSIQFNWLASRKVDQRDIQAFFIEYLLLSFQNLCSLKLWSITSNTDFFMIIDQLPFLSRLTSLHIQINLGRLKLTADEFQHAYEIIFRYCVALKRLDITIDDNLDPRKNIHKEVLLTQPIATQIEHLKFNQLYMEELDCILSPSSLPQIKSFSAMIYDTPERMDFSSEELTLNSLTNLRLHFDCGLDFTSLESILKRTPNLKTLVIGCKSVILIDHKQWQNFLSQYLLKVEKLHLHAVDWYGSEWFKRNEYLDFQTSTYWLTERNGLIETKYKRVMDLADSISVTFRTNAFKNWEGKCEYCLSPVSQVDLCYF